MFELLNYNTMEMKPLFLKGLINALLIEAIVIVILIL